MRRIAINEVPELYSDNGVKHIRGYGAVYYSGDPLTQFAYGRYVERIQSGAFDRVLGEIEQGKKVIVVRYDHQQHKILGKTSNSSAKVWTDSKGLLYDVAVDERDSDIMEAVQGIENKTIKGSSFGMWPSLSKHKISHTGDKVVITHTDLEVWECSPVENPAFKGSSVGVVHSIDADLERYFQTLEILSRYHK